MWFSAHTRGNVYGARRTGMSSSELARLDIDAEAHAELRNTLSRCRSRQELLRSARHLGHRVTRTDLQNAWHEHQQGQPASDQDTRAAIAAGTRDRVGSGQDAKKCKGRCAE
jgi:hypothetical protein